MFAGTSECSWRCNSKIEADAIEMALYLNTHIPISDAKVESINNITRQPKGCGVHGVVEYWISRVKAMWTKMEDFCNGMFLGEDMGKATISIFRSCGQITRSNYTSLKASSNERAIK